MNGIKEVLKAAKQPVKKTTEKPKKDVFGSVVARALREYKG